jgi:hypothetical protein
MSSIHDQIASSYASHPGFTFPEAPFALDEAWLERFTAAYTEFRLLGNLLNPGSLGAVQEELLRCLRQIFSSLLSQCADDHEACFIRELQQQCERLLSDELAWYRKAASPRFVQLADAAARANAVRLRNDKHYFGCFGPDAVARLQETAAGTLTGLRANAATSRLRREDLSVNSGATVRRIRKLLNQEFKALGVLDAVSTYTGRKTSVQGLALELSVRQATWWNNAIVGLSRPPGTLYAHLDESISFPKAIVYLTDVAAGNGPTGCFPGAYAAMGLNPLQELVGRIVGNVGASPDSPLHAFYAKTYHQSTSSPGFRRHFMRLPECMRFNSHLGWDVTPGSELETSLTGCEKLMTGPAGTFIVFDGARLLHRGGMVQQGERVALQVIFSDVTPAQRVVNKIRTVIQ